MLFFGLRGGINTSIIFEEINPDGFTIVGRHIGYNFGPTVHFEPSKFIGFNSGILFNSTGWVQDKKKLFDTLTSRKDVFKNIQIPATISLKFGIGSVTRIFIEGGVYSQVAVSGYSDIEDLYGRTYTRTINWVKSKPTESSDFAYKRVNMGFIFGAGYQYKGLQIGTSYNLGLLDITKNDVRMHNHIWNFYLILRTWKR